MKKLITWTSLILAVSLFAEPGQNNSQLKRSMKVVPLSSIYLSTENGGTNHASAALADGVGVYITQEDEYARAISYLNGKYGDDALKNEKSLKEYVLDTGTVADKELANKLNLATAQKSNPGDSCNDGKIETMDDMYTDDAFTCVGKIIIGSECNDENAGTTGDVYVDNNFTCKGQNSVIGATCDDDNPQTKNDVYKDINFICKGTKIYYENKCYGDATGDEFVFEGKTYLVVDNDTIKANLDRAETLCTSNVTNMSSLFYDNTSFNQPIGDWDTSNVTDMSWMFYDTTSFNQAIGGWNTSNVTSMFAMFDSATSFNQPLNWNTSNVKDMGNMFLYAISFNQPIGGWDTSNVTDMSWMFLNAKSFNKNISNWNVLNVIDYTYFAEESALTSANAPSDKNGTKFPTTK